MKCDEVHTLIDDYYDDELSIAEVEHVKTHCASCESCTVRLNDLRLINEALTTLPFLAASEGFENRVIKTAISDSQATQFSLSKNNKALKFAVLAMLSVVVIILGLYDGVTENEKSLNLFAVDENVRTIKLAIDSEQMLDAVTMRVELSDNLELAGFGSRKTIHWTTNLKEGVNVISLPIVGIAQGKGNITTRVLLNGKEKVLHIQTQYKIPDNVLIQDGVVNLG